MPPPKNQGSKVITLDNALVNYLGQLGKHQIKVLLLASILWIPNAIFILLMVFTAKDPVQPRWWRCKDENDAACMKVYGNDGSIMQEFCELPRDSWTWTEAHKSIISTFNLICGKAVIAQLANSAFFLGYLIGSGVFGSLSDSRGRKLSLFGATALASICTVMTALSPNEWVYLVSRILTGIGAAGQALAAYILATESIGPTWRGAAGVGTQLFFVLGEFVLVLVAFIFQGWRALCFASVIIGAVTLGLWFFLPESPRWLLVRGRVDEAMRVLEVMAKENGTRMPIEPLADPKSALPAPPPTVHAPEDQQMLLQNHGAAAAAHANGAAHGPDAGAAPAQAGKPPVTLMSALKDKHICRRFTILAYAWLVLCMTYYGISMALNGLKGSIYVTFMVAAAAEIPSNILAAWMIERVGRHNTMAAGMLLGGLSCLACSFCPPGAGQSILAAVGKFGCAGAFTVASIFTSEMFPTLIRSAVLGVENQAARVGGILAPFIVLAGTYMGSSAMPFLM